MTYRERREARADRLRGWADKREDRAAASFGKAEQISSMIPMGQPILVGHHSERGHRRDLDRIDRGMRDSIESSRMAESMRSRADNIDAAAGHAIYSDDEDAVERLRERIAGLEAERARVTAYNASCRKGAPDLSLLDERQQRALVSALQFQPERFGQRMPAYVSANLSGNISRQRKRLAMLEAKS